MGVRRVRANRYTADEIVERRYEQAISIIRVIDDRRKELGYSRAELARRAGILPQALRRLLQSDEPNPTLFTLVALADALDLELKAVLISAKRRAARQRREQQ